MQYNTIQCKKLYSKSVFIKVTNISHSRRFIGYTKCNVYTKIAYAVSMPSFSVHSVTNLCDDMQCPMDIFIISS